MHSSSSLSTMTTEEDNVVRVPHNRLELLSRTAAWRNLMDRSTEEVSDIPSFPGRVTPAEPGVFFPDPSFGSRSVNSSSVHSWTAVRPVTRNDMSFDEGEHTPSHAFGNYCDQSKPPAAALDSSERATLALEKNQHSHNMLRPQPVSSFARPKPSLPSASNGHLSMQAAFAPPRSCAFTEQSTSTGRLASRPAGPPPSLHSQYLPGNPPESYYAYSSSSICTLRPTPARSVSAVATLPQSDRSWMSHPPTNHHGSHGGYATLPSSEGPSYQALVDENAKLRHQTQQKDAAVAALEAKVRHLETQIEELRQLPTGKISHIPIQDMLTIMEEYGSETTEATLSIRRKAANVQKSSVVRQFRRWNPNFLESFSFRQGEWVPNLGRQGELDRRVRARSQTANTRKKKTSSSEDQDQNP